MNPTPPPYSIWTYLDDDEWMAQNGGVPDVMVAHGLTLPDAHTARERIEMIAGNRAGAVEIRDASGQVLTTCAVRTYGGGHVIVITDYFPPPARHRRHLTEAQATECRTIVQAYIDRTEGPGWKVAIHPPGHEGKHWVASLECQADNWPYAISNDKTITWPPGVRVEAANHFALSLTPA